MNNKYKTFSSQAQRKRRRARMCTRKRAFETEAEAYQKGQEVYLCPYCKKYHRSGKRASFLAELRGNHEPN